MPAPRPLSRIRRLRTLAAVVAAAGVASGGAGVAEAAAQSPSRAALPDIERRIDVMQPKSGPPGTRVRVASGEMPSITPIRVGLGGVRSGFEALESLLTTMDGTFDVTLSVPGWAQWDRVHRWVVFDIYFRPIALSELFHVTNAEGLVRREGHVMEMPGGCFRLEDRDGVGYALTGPAAEGLAEGAAVIQGRVARAARCGSPYTLEVVEAGAR